MNRFYDKKEAADDLKLLGLSPSSFVEEAKLQASAEISTVYENLINAQFRKLARTHHPDRGGDITLFQQISNARDRLLARDVVFSKGDHDHDTEEKNVYSSSSDSDKGFGQAMYCPKCKNEVQPPMPAETEEYMAPFRNISNPFYNCRLFRCPHCNCILKNPLSPTLPKTSADKIGLRGYAGSINPFAKFVIPSNIGVVWRCTKCEVTNSVCCRVQRSKGLCLCGHKLMDHNTTSKEPWTGSKRNRPLRCEYIGCACPEYMYHCQQGHWQVKCECKHKHTDHDPVTQKCNKMKPGRNPCKCQAFSASWKCHCGHNWCDHITDFVPGNGKADDLRRQWVVSGLRKEMKSIAQARRDKWVANGRAPANASYTAKIAVAKGIPMGKRVPQVHSNSKQISLIDRKLSEMNVCTDIKSGCNNNKNVLQKRDKKKFHL
eukprot:g2012.t1